MSTPSPNVEPPVQTPPPAQILPSLIRTIVPMIVGWVLTQLALRGLNIPESFATQVVTALVTAAYYGAARLLETRFKPVWGWLLGLPKAPTYEAPAAPSETSPSGVQATVDTPGAILPGAPVEVVPDGAVPEGSGETGFIDLDETGADELPVIPPDLPEQRNFLAAFEDVEPPVDDHASAPRDVDDREDA